MDKHEITFNTNLSEPPRTHADFTYKISPIVISISDTGLDSHSALEESRRSYEKSSIGIKARSQSSRSCAETEKDFGTRCGGTAKLLPFSLCRKPMREKLARSCSSPNEIRLLYTPSIHSRFEISRVWRRTKIQIQIPQKSQPSHGKPKLSRKIDRLVKGDEPIGEKLKDAVDDHSQACDDFKQELESHKHETPPPYTEPEE